MSPQLSDEHVVADVLAAEEAERAQVGAVPREGVERLRVQKVALGEDLVSISIGNPLRRGINLNLINIQP